ncbi:hypothetical protein GCM10027040_07240 [Halomonas shantousis]
MFYRFLSPLILALGLTMEGGGTQADPAMPEQMPSMGKEVPQILILASYHDGDAWTDSLVRNLRYYLESANQNVRVRVHYLEARDQPASDYLADDALHDSANRLRPYDRLVLLDDAALAFYLRHSSTFSGPPPIAIGINSSKLAELARVRGVPLALTSEAMTQSAILARQVTGKHDLLLLHSATDAGFRLGRQALDQIPQAGFERVIARTWQSVYTDTRDYSSYAILALDAPLRLARRSPAPALAAHFQEKFSAFFCHAGYLLDYGCDGGAFVNVASLSHLVARHLLSRDVAAPTIEVPLELNLSHALLDQVPRGLDVRVFDAPDAERLPLWGRMLIAGMTALLFLVALIAWWRLHSQQRQVHLATRQSEHDTLTGLYNRRKMTALLAEMTSRREPFGLLYLDLDGFKEINDTFGHAHGDRLLQCFARLLGTIAGPEAAYGRMDSDEFLILSDRLQCPLPLAERIVEALQDPFIIEGHHHTLHCTVGIALFPQHARHPAGLLKRADAAMSAAKRDPDTPIVLFTSRLLDDQSRHFAYSRELERTLDEQDSALELYIQPIHSLKRDTTVGGEVLLRWHHPERGDISPGLFIPIAEASDLILKLNEWVVERTFQRMAAEQLYRHIDFLSINISAKQLYARCFAGYVIALAERYAIPTRSVSFEMTEHVRLLDMASVQEQIAELREAGFGVALDDFGAGYTSISFLQDIPFSSVKIDRSLTAGLCGHNADASRHLMQGLLYLGEQLSQRVVVEGVETQGQSDLLHSMGVDHVQGFHYYRPMPWVDFSRHIGTSHRPLPLREE